MEAASHRFARVFVALALVTSTGSTLLGCSTFGTYDQQSGYEKMSTDLKKIVRDRNRSAEKSAQGFGVLVIFDTSGPHPDPRITMTGDTASSAMYSLVVSHGDPCVSREGKAAIAGYAPPLSVDLPFEFAQCTELRDKVEVLAAQTQTLGRLMAATKGNNTSIAQLTRDLSDLAKAQHISWGQVTKMLGEMSGHPDAPNSGE